jgi:cell division protein FtsB
MARALLGYVGTGNEQVLASEIARLRRRVADLEAELAELKDGRRADLDLELHRLADSATPALA